MNAEPSDTLHSGRLDKVDLAILAKRIDGIASKMQNTLLRTARSGVINTGRDFSCCILTADSKLLAAAESLPIHVMVGPDMMADTMKRYHPELSPGDAFLHNSPYHGCSHAADLSVLVPVIDSAGVHRFTVLSKAHQADIGNSVPTTYHAAAQDVYEEGALLFPATQVQRDYRDIGDIIRLCELRIRVPEQWRGDYLASLGAARVAERELLQLGTELGWEKLAAFVEGWFDYSETMMKLAIGKLPAGVSVGTCRHDPFPGTPIDGVCVTAAVAVDPQNARVVIDLTDNIDCMPNGLNLSEACSRTAAMVGLFNSLGTNVPNNAGSFRRIDVKLRENCAVGIPVHPYSCSVATQNVADRLTNAVQLAFAALGEGFGLAEIGGAQSAGQAVVSGKDPRRQNAPYVDQLILGDTLGAAGAAADGWLAMITAGTAGMSFYDSIEIDETRRPLVVHQRRLLADTEGAGRHRGAFSSLVEFGPLGAPMRVLSQSDGRLNPPQGVRGGLSGGAARNFVTRSDGTIEDLDGVFEVELNPGDRITGISAAGGGYGHPYHREPHKVKRDVREGYVSRQRARHVYGVILNADSEIDTAGTNELRIVMDCLGPRALKRQNGDVKMVRG